MISGTPFRNLLITVLLVLSALPLWADQKKRGVQKPPSAGVPVSPPAAEATIVGTVVDAVSNGPVINAEIFATSIGRYARTGGDGVFRLKVPVGGTVTLTISRFGYERQTVTVAVASAGSLPQRFSMTSTPSVMIRTISGTVYQIATETVEFGYNVPFGGFNKDRKVTMCKPDGTPFSPETSEMKRVRGPAVMVANSPCCGAGGSASRVTLDLRSGESTQAFFSDSCFGYAMEVIGLDQVTAQLVDIKLTEVNEIVFP
jgi:carboxypeptidase family protein